MFSIPKAAHACLACATQMANATGLPSDGMMTVTATRDDDGAGVN